MSDVRDQLLVPVSTRIPAELGIVHDIPMRLTMEVGRMKLTVAEFLRLSPESVLELKKVAGEAFEIAVNGLVVARGEVVMVEQRSGVRIVEILKSTVTS